MKKTFRRGDLLFEPDHYDKEIVKKWFTTYCELDKKSVFTFTIYIKKKFTYLPFEVGDQTWTDPAAYCYNLQHVPIVAVI
jgi:hypothetical protein